MNIRKILHFDLDAFFCAVEEKSNPALAGLPFAVGGRPDQRGVVASCSYPARMKGVRSAMPMSQAVRLCPELLIVDSHMGEYSRVSAQVMAILHELTPLVEQLSVDEAFLDVSSHSQPPEEMARTLQSRVRDALGLPASLGVATNKLVAKIATDVGKAAVRSGDYPRSIQVVPPGQEAAFLAPLPVDALWGVGPKTAEKLAELGIHTIGDIARFPASELARRFGKNGNDLHRRAQGIDPREIVTEREAKSISQETTFATDLADGQTLARVVTEQAGQVAHRLAREKLAARTVTLKLRWPDFTTLTRQSTGEQPISSSQEIARLALQLLADNRPPGQPVRLIGVGVSGLGPLVHQMSIWELPAHPAEQAKAERLNDAVQALRKRFGQDAVRRASALD
ncbi:MAG: DNA polymerase IV [Caldilineaceae bacterium]|nr:DNA polymerase IV [Caldilineaceae bacterium]